jgi:hypothetical protein
LSAIAATAAYGMIAGMKRNSGSRNLRTKVNQRRPQERTGTMASKADLEGILDSIQELADDALDPELSREDVVAKVKQIYDLASGEDSDDDDSGE